jgi:hypothetical protein
MTGSTSTMLAIGGRISDSMAASITASAMVGSGYEGGYWRGGVVTYNRTVNNFGSTHITNVYDKTVINNTTAIHVSFNGGSGGTAARPGTSLGT